MKIPTRMKKTLAIGSEGHPHALSPGEEWDGITCIDAAECFHSPTSRQPPNVQMTHTLPRAEFGVRLRGEGSAHPSLVCNLAKI